MNIYIYIYIYLCVNIYIYICVNIYIYIYIITLIIVRESLNLLRAPTMLNDESSFEDIHHVKQCLELHGDWESLTESPRDSHTGSVIEYL